MVLCRLFASAKNDILHLIQPSSDDLNNFSSSQEAHYGSNNLVEQYREFLEIFENNREIRHDIEILESVILESVVRNDDTSLSNVIVSLQRDHVTIAIIHILRGMATYYDHIRDEERFKNSSNTLSVLIDLAWYVQELMVGTLLEFEEVVEEHDEDKALPILLDELVRSLCMIFKDTADSLAEFWEEIVTNFPVNKDVCGNRFSCKNNSFLSSIESIESRQGSSVETIRKADRDLLSNLSELTLIYTLECSFVLITSYNTLSLEHGSYKVQNKFNHQLEKLVKKLMWFRSKSAEATENCDKRVHGYLSETYGMTTAQVNGPLVPIENRFGVEYRLYDNSSAMVSIGTDILKILENIRDEAFQIVTQESRLSQSHGDEHNTNADSVQDAAAATPAIRFKTLQSELEAKINLMVTYSKLESQLLSKTISMNLKGSKLESDGANTKAARKDYEPNPNDSDETSNSEYDALPPGNSLALNYETGHLRDDGPETQERELLDELFELVPGREAEDDSTHFLEAQAPSDDDDVHEARQVVLEQLKTALKPRQEAMKSREEEAYKRAYGERNEDNSDDLEDVDPPAKSKKKRKKRKKKLSLTWGDEDTPNGNDIGDISFGDGDEIDSGGSDKNLFSQDFKSKLDKILKSGNI